jgi:hypothetical protein
MAFDYPELMPQMLATRAEQQGSGTALKHVDGSTLRWDEAYADALRWADALKHLGAGHKKNNRPKPSDLKVWRRRYLVDGSLSGLAFAVRQGRKSGD